jgi:hypothetical protein
MTRDTLFGKAGAFVEIFARDIVLRLNVAERGRVL